MKERRPGWQDGSTVIVKWDEKTRYNKKYYLETGMDEECILEQERILW